MQAQPRRGLGCWCECGPVRAPRRPARVPHRRDCRLPPRKRAGSRRFKDLRTERHLGPAFLLRHQPGENRTGPERPVAARRTWFRLHIQGHPLNLGAWSGNGVSAGLCALNLANAASNANGNIGCRLASAPAAAGSRACGQSATWGVCSFSGISPEKTGQGRNGL